MRTWGFTLTFVCPPYLEQAPKFPANLKITSVQAGLFDVTHISRGLHSCCWYNIHAILSGGIVVGFLSI